MTLGTDNPWNGVIVFVGGERWDGVRGSHRQLAEALARRRPVLYVDNPISPATSRSRASSAIGAGVRPGLRMVGPQMAVLVPAALPGLSRPGIRVTTAWLIRRAVRRALVELGRPAVKAIVVASLDDLLTSCRADRRLVYATDDYVAGASLMGIDPRYLQRCERRQSAKADGVVVVSDELAARWRGLGHDPLVVPNGCDGSAYAAVAGLAPATEVTLPTPIAGVVGRLSARIDLSLLEAVADRGRSLLLVGPLDPSFEPARMQSLVARPNVQLVGPVSFEALPPFLAAMHTGLTPYADSAFNRASFPLKTLEYLAAGRSVVATDLPAHRWLQTDLVGLADGQRGFADAVDAALDRESSAALVAERQAFAAQHNWDERAGEVLADLDRSPVGVAASPPVGREGD
jgi:teichuronic acid biosynthesis glycosyltransferase TuaH